jgi:hypothetical protein
MAQPARRVEEDRPTYSGRLLLRMPPELHQELARQAERDRVSLNQFITGAVSRAVGWSSTAGVGGAAGPFGERARGPVSNRALRAALMVNLAVLTIAGAAAIALLVVAVTRL